MNPNTAPVILTAAGYDWTSEEARAAREMKAWLRRHGRRQEDAKLGRELHFDSTGHPRIGDENHPDLTDLALINLGVEPEPERDWVEIDDIPGGFTVWDMADNRSADEMDEDQFLTLLGLAREIERHPLVTELGIAPTRLINNEDVPYGAAELAIIEQAVRDAKLINETGYVDAEDLLEYAIKEGKRLAQYSQKAKERLARQREREAKIEQARQGGLKRAKGILKRAKVIEVREDRDWMGREVHPSGAKLFGCHGQVRPRYGRGPSRPCSTRGEAKTMVVNMGYARHQLGRPVEVWDIHQFTMCPNCAARITKSAQRNNRRAPQFATVEAAIAQIERAEAKLPQNNVHENLPGIGSVRRSRCAIIVDWAKDDAWIGLFGTCRGWPDWAALEQSMGIGKLDLGKLSHKLVPAWEVQGNPRAVNWRRLVDMEHAQREHKANRKASRRQQRNRGPRRSSRSSRSSAGRRY